MWNDMKTAPSTPSVGARGEIILGCLTTGDIVSMFWHVADQVWLSGGYPDEGLVQVTPILWAHLPDHLRDKDGKARYQADGGMFGTGRHSA